MFLNKFLIYINVCQLVLFYDIHGERRENERY
jgi:hypothetical protein